MHASLVSFHHDEKLWFLSTHCKTSGAVTTTGAYFATFDAHTGPLQPTSRFNPIDGVPLDAFDVNIQSEEISSGSDKRDLTHIDYSRKSIKSTCQKK